MSQHFQFIKINTGNINPKATLNISVLHHVRA